MILITGANPTENHPVAATFIKNAVKRGAKLIIMDPRGQDMMRHATHSLRFKAGSDVAMLNALIHVIIEENLYDEQYIQANVSGFEALKAKVKDFSPEAMAEVCGVEASVLRDVARTYARAERWRPHRSVAAHLLWSWYGAVKRGEISLEDVA